MKKETDLLAYIFVTTVFLTFVISTLTLGVVIHQSDPLDVNQDGQANIVDLSVLAATLNDRQQSYNGCVASAYQAAKHGFSLEENLAICETK